MLGATPIHVKFGGRVTYVAAALGFLFLGLLGHDPAFFVVMLFAVALCLAQAYFQSRMLWAVISVAYLAGALLYSWALVRDVIALMSGASLKVLLNPVDSAVVLTFVVFLIAMVFALFRLNPYLSNTQSGV